MSKPKNRHKFISCLAHFKDLKPGLFEKVSGNAESQIEEALTKNNLDNTQCYIISENNDIDTKTLNAKEGINEIGGYRTGTILVFGNAEIVFYEGETIRESYLSKLLT